MRYIIGARYFPGDITLEIEAVNKPRNNNVRLLQVGIQHPLKILEALEYLFFNRYLTLLLKSIC